MVSRTVDMEEDIKARNTGRINRPECFLCPECGREFTKLGLIYHKKTCSEKEDCQCAACKISNYRVNVDSHAIVNAMKSNDVSQNTNLDPVKYPQSKIIIIHKSVTKKNDDIVMQSEIPVIEPALNFEEFQNKGIKCNYKENVSEKENNNLQVSAEVSESVDLHGGEPCTRQLFCVGCDHHMPWESFSLHLIQDCSELEDGNFLCCACPKAFRSPTMLLIHYNIHASSHPIDCLKCRCSYEHCLEATAQTATEPRNAKIYRCYICLKGFLYENSIAHHMRLHVRENDFKCTVCPRSFTEIGNLQRHMKTHQELHLPKYKESYQYFAGSPRPYTCSMCMREFKRLGNLKRHVCLVQKNKRITSSDSSSFEDDMLHVEF